MKTTELIKSIEQYCIRTDCVERLKELHETLTDLVDLQNGAPLERYKDEWNKVMDKAYELIK